MFHVIALWPDGMRKSVGRSSTREGAEECLRMLKGSIAMHGGIQDPFTLHIEEREETES